MDISTGEIAHEIWIFLWKRNLTRTTETLLIAIQNNTISKNLVKANIDNI